MHGSSLLMVIIADWKLPMGVHTVQVSGQHVHQNMPHQGKGVDRWVRKVIHGLENSFKSSFAVFTVLLTGLTIALGMWTAD